MRGFDPNMSVAMDQSINVESMGDLGQQVPFNADESMVASYRSSSQYQPPTDFIPPKCQQEDIKPHPGGNPGGTSTQSQSEQLSENKPAA